MRTLEFCAIGLQNVVGAIVHHAVLQSAVEENISTDVVDPILFPALERGVVDVVALARVSTAKALAVFLNHAILQDEFYFAVSGRDRPQSRARNLRRAGHLSKRTFRQIILKRKPHFSHARAQKPGSL